MVQFVDLMKSGERGLSKRTGDIVELREVVDEVGADAARSPSCSSPSTARRPSISTW